jgi:1,4-alpha-glucan branching enzyme
MVQKSSATPSFNEKMTQAKTAFSPGMGAMPHSRGCTFRVWAPHAESVSVVSEQWGQQQHKLNHEGNGYWAADVLNAKVGDEYRYLIINGEAQLLRNDPYAREVKNSVGNSIIHDPAFDWEDDAFHLSPLNELIIYEMHIGTFNREDPKAPGTFENAIAQLSHLKELGINAVELMPVAEFAGGISWGYNPAHMFAVESDYGGPRAFKQFVKAAHSLGIGVLLDVVYNHFGPSDLDLWQFDGWSENGLGGIYFYNDHRAKTPWGDTRPDYGRPEVRQFIRDNALMWLDEYHVDGLRFDSVANIRSILGDGDPNGDLPEGWSLLQWLNEEIRTKRPTAYTIAEDLKANDFLTRPIQQGGAGFYSQWDGGFLHNVRKTLATTDDSERDLNIISEAIHHRFNTDAFERVIYTESHDDVAEGDVRVPEQLAPGEADNWLAKKRSTLGAVLVFTSPGVPMIFQGQELLEGGQFDDSQPLDWSKREKHSGIFQLYADLIRLRLNRNGQTHGLAGQHVQVLHAHHELKLLAFQRWADDGDPVVVVLNLSHRAWEDYEVQFPKAGQWHVCFNSDAAVYDGEFTNIGQPAVEAVAMEQAEEMPRAKLNIAPYSALILSPTPMAQTAG